MHVFLHASPRNHVLGAHGLLGCVKRPEPHLLAVIMEVCGPAAELPQPDAAESVVALHVEAWSGAAGGTNWQSFFWGNDAAGCCVLDL
jgi:hypothetical protein